MTRLEKVIELMIDATPGRVQPEGGSYFPRTLPYEGLVDVTWPRDRIERFIRAMYFPPFSPAGVIREGELHHVRNLDEYLRLFEL